MICVVAAPTAPPENLSVTNVDRDYIAYSWEQPKCGDRNGIIQQYLYSMSTGEEGVSEITSLNISNLNPCTEYTFAISAVTNMGTGPEDSVSETTKSEGKLKINSSVQLISLWNVRFFLT